MRVEGGDSGPPGPRSTLSEDGSAEALRRASREGTERWIAVAVGAVEGIVEGLHGSHLAEDAEHVIHDTGRLVRGTTQEARHQAQAPEIQQAEQGVRRAAERVRGQTQQAFGAVTQQVRETRDTMQEQVETLREDVASRYEGGKQLIVERVDQAKEMVQDARETVREVKEETKARLHAVAESGRRAKEAPAVIADDLKEAARSTLRGFTQGMLWYSAAGVVGAAAFIVLTVALVSGLNIWLGAPWGAFITAGLYAFTAGGLAAYAKASRDESRKEARQHIEHIGEETRYVVRPVQQAFSKEPLAPRLTH